MNLLNPYELLGVSTQSSLNTLKKKYYSLALICHPDKGGDENDMIMIKNAYDYIKPQLENNTDTTYEQLEDEFQKFCDNQKKKLCPFSEVYEESHDWIKEFNKTFDEKKKNKQDNSNDLDPKYLMEKGYGELMDNDKIELGDCKYNETVIGKLNNKFNNELVIYDEPAAKPIDFGEYERFDVKEIMDFTHVTDNFNMNDYKKAHSDPEDIKKFPFTKVENVSERYKQLCEERQAELENIHKS